jgi:hypothetical protein
MLIPIFSPLSGKPFFVSEENEAIVRRIYSEASFGLACIAKNRLSAGEAARRRCVLMITGKVAGEAKRESLLREIEEAFTLPDLAMRAARAWEAINYANKNATV